MKLRTIATLSALALILASPVLAQQAAQQTTAPPVDTRIAPKAMAALQAMVNLREAQLTALQEDAQKREQEWAEYSKSLWNFPATSP